jgi:hypothetical protein
MNMTIFRFLVLVGAGGALSCSSLQSVSSGHIGCAEKDIVITNDDRAWAARTWTAECHGKRFFCSAIQTGKDQMQVNCREETPKAGPPGVASAPSAPIAPSGPPPEPKATAPGGCQFDTQCKGERICVSGQCVEPDRAQSNPEQP